MVGHQIGSVLHSIFVLDSIFRARPKLFPEKETVFHHLGRYLFYPSNQVWGLITIYYHAYLAKADEGIGIQSVSINEFLKPAGDRYYSPDTRGRGGHGRDSRGGYGGVGAK
ncbi:Fucosyltransferase 2 [Camellia lanceoleosa]|uniref:Fucosyltransferase 2 n=1 Tax=Camellia lanceoleosa TaxID=1840588 RepID=A0ACC0G864_9ERIC|nr:Fucosyltransferase 2 [Camellia lanceoleosa]